MTASGRSRLPTRRLLLAAIAVAVVLATFAYALPEIADYRDVWSVLRAVSWPWIAGLAAVTLLNLLTFAPPWLVVLPGLAFGSALVVTQVSTALATVVPGGPAVGIAGTYGILRRWGFSGREIGRALAVVSVWNQFVNLSYPAIAVVLLALFGAESPALLTAGIIGAVVLAIAAAAVGGVLSSARAATALGDLSARVADWVLARLRRQPVVWSGTSFERFRSDAADLLRRRWHVLTAATYAGTLTIFLVLLVALRAVGVPGSEVSLVEAFAAWSLARLLGTVPVTPGGLGVVELGLTAALLAFGGSNAGVVAAVLVYRFLTVVPTIVLGLLGAAVARRETFAAALEAAREPAE